jgi:hypothetical protein
LFGTTKESELTDNQTKKLLQTLESKSTWFIKRHNATSGIFSLQCERFIKVLPGDDTTVCKQCELLKQENSLKKAINTKYATNDNIKFIPAGLMKRDLFQSKLISFEELCQLNSLLEKQLKAGNSEFWTTLAIQAKRGFFKDKDSFQGLVKAVAV